MSTYLHSMETAVTFIEDHLQDDIKVADIATAVSYSLFHFCRVFNQTVHHSPYDYLMRRRLTCAAQQLVEGKERITDIAFVYQFGSPESFSRAFRRMFNQLPKTWRKQGIRDPRLLMKRITRQHLEQRNDPTFKRPMLVQKPELTVVGLMTIVQDEAYPEPAARQAISHLKQQLPQLPTHTITHYPDEWAVEGKPVFVGTMGEVAAPPFVSQTIPANEYACFVLPESLAAQLPLTDYIYQTWLPQSGYRLAIPLELEQEQQLFVPIVLDR